MIILTHSGPRPEKEPAQPLVWHQGFGKLSSRFDNSTDSKCMKLSMFARQLSWEIWKLSSLPGSYGMCVCVWICSNLNVWVSISIYHLFVYFTFLFGIRHSHSIIWHCVHHRTSIYIHSPIHKSNDHILSLAYVTRTLPHRNIRTY